jgi:hypothetical protein
LAVSMIANIFTPISGVKVFAIMEMSYLGGTVRG